MAWTHGAPRRAAARLYGLGTSLPPNAADQPTVQRFMTELARATLNGRSARATAVIEKLYASSGIDRRHSVLADYAKDDPRDFAFFPPNWALEPFPSTARRMELFERWSVDLAASAARQALAQSKIGAHEVTHVVFTTCTGFFAPGPDVLLIERLGLKDDVERLQIGFMGCYAGFNAMKAAAQIVAFDPAAVVLVLSVELCSLHFQRTPLPDYLVANSLFADGAGAAVFAAPGARPGGLGDLIASYGRVAQGSLGQMSWRLGPTGFEMRLDRLVPATLRADAPAFVARLLERAGLGRGEVLRWALHPGGRRIIEAVAEALRLDSQQTRSAREVLAASGNMSSATIFFVLVNELKRGLDGPVAALGFGPGLTMEGAVFAPPRH